MRVVIFCHSLVSCWNHGNAHFLRGVATELLSRGCDLRIYEPAEGWSRTNLVRDHGADAVAGFERAYPQLRGTLYEGASPDLDEALAGADLAIVHEWNDPELVARIGAHRAARGDYVLLFHDTHHRSVSDRISMSRYDLSGYDGVLAFGEVIRDIYLERNWARRAWVWHEAADTRVFRPLPRSCFEGDLVWIGNWGDEERTEELDEFLLEPVKRLGLRARAYGVRYPESGRRALAAACIEYGGWLPNYRAPEVFARFRVTVHIPRRFYAQILPGIATIRVFEALACGIPLVSSPWRDTERLFTPGEDFLVARNAREMTAHIASLLADPALARRMARRALKTVRARHTCAHRVDELMLIYEQARTGREVAA